MGETRLFEAAVAAHVSPGDVLVADRAYDGYYCYGLLQMSGTDAVVRMHKRRDCPLKKGRSEAFATLQRPRQHKRPKHYSKEQWLAMPERIHVRFVRVNLARPGFRSTEVTGVTTILDAPALHRNRPRPQTTRLIRAKSPQAKTKVLSTTQQD